ncbi:MAG: hypothetical protein KGJ13_05035 [Patescibacteria group bacterium]|nr:hypothetical protein [Patescibacteria group bacterium]
MNLKSLMNSTLIPAGVGAAGALGLDVALGFASPHLPAFLNNGVMKTVTRVAGAVGIGYVAGAIAGKRFGEEAMAGAITVTLYDLLKGMVKSAVPSLPLSGTGWVSPAYQVGAYVGTDSAFAHPGLSAYVGSDFVYDGIRDPSLSGYDYDY